MPEISPFSRRLELPVAMRLFVLEGVEKCLFYWLFQWSVSFHIFCHLPITSDNFQNPNRTRNAFEEYSRGFESLTLRQKSTTFDGELSIFYPSRRLGISSFFVYLAKGEVCKKCISSKAARRLCISSRRSRAYLSLRLDEIQLLRS